jgi:hypothetical protein
LYITFVCAIDTGIVCFQLCIIQSSFDINEIRVLLDSYYPSPPPEVDLDSRGTQAIHQTPIISDSPYQV